MTISKAHVVDTVWLAEHLDDEKVVLVDVRPPHFVAQAHLSGAVNLPVFLLYGPDAGPPESDQLASRLSSVGISRDSHVVAYDEGGSPSAARLYWVLKYYGHPDVSVLDGGITKWRREGLDWEYEATSAPAAQYDVPLPDRTVLSTLTDVRAAIDDEGAVILDARSPAEYLGLQMTAARNGHVPGSVNTDWANNFEAPDGVPVLLPDDQLRRMYEDAGADHSKHIVVYCQSGGRSAATYLVLRHLGYPYVSMYSAGWQEWGNRQDTPVEEE